MHDGSSVQGSLPERKSGSELGQMHVCSSFIKFTSPSLLQFPLGGFLGSELIARKSEAAGRRPEAAGGRTVPYTRRRRARGRRPLTSAAAPQARARPEAALFRSAPQARPSWAALLVRSTPAEYSTKDAISAAYKHTTHGDE